MLLDSLHRGDKIPKINYNANEIGTWGNVWDKLYPLLHRHACKEHVRLLPLLVDNCGYRRDNIPQLEDISSFLKGDGSFASLFHRAL
jgi:phenylalanine-4-hydroxylase